KKTSPAPLQRFQKALPAMDAASERAIATPTHTQEEETTPALRIHQTTSTGMTVTAVVATAACGRYRVALEVLCSLKTCVHRPDARPDMRCPQRRAAGRNNLS